MDYTDKDYNILDKKVYDIPKERYDIGGTITTYDGREYRVIDIENNTTNGMQAYAVAPVDKNNNTDYNQVVVSYAGTNMNELADIYTDVETIGMGSNSYYEPEVKHGLVLPGIVNPGMSNLLVTWKKKGEAQSVDALNFYNRVEQKVKANGGTVSPETSGHSLGGSLSMYVAVKKKVSCVAFNGPDTKNMLSEDECKHIKTHPMDFMNYRNPYDLVGNITGNETKSANYVASPYKGPWLGHVMDYHGIDKWQFDENGNLIMVDGKPVNDKTNQKFIKSYSQTRNLLASRLGNLNSQFGSGTGYGSSEVIFLEVVAAYYLKDAIINHANQGLDAINKTYIDGKTNQAKGWTDAKRAAYRIGKDLSSEECRTALAAGQATKQTLVTAYTNQINSKQSTIDGVRSEFSSFNTIFTSKIKEKVADDQAWASQFGINFNS